MSKITLIAFIDGKHVANIVRSEHRPGFWCADLVHFVDGKQVSFPVQDSDQATFRLAGLVEKIEATVRQRRERSIAAAESLLAAMRQAKVDGVWDVMQELPEWQRLKAMLDDYEPQGCHNDQPCDCDFCEADDDEPCGRCGIQPCDCGDC